MTSPRPRMVPFEPSHLWDRFIDWLCERAQAHPVSERELIVREVKWWAGFAAIELGLMAVVAAAAVRMWR